MSKWRFGIRWLVWPAIAAIVVFIGLAASSAPVAQADPSSTMSVEPSNQLVALGDPFTVDIKVVTDDSTFAGYQVHLTYDTPGLSLSSITQLQPAGMTTCGGTDIATAGVAYDYGCANTSAAVGAFTGNVTEIEGACGDTPGTYDVHFVDTTTDPDYGSTLADTTGGFIDTTLVDGQVTCVAASDVEVTKNHTPEPMLVGSEGVYTLTVTNNGPAEAKGVVAADVVPEDKEVQGTVLCVGGEPLMPCSVPVSEGYAPLDDGYYIGPATWGFPEDSGLDMNQDGTADLPCAYYPSGYPNLYPPPATFDNLVACYIAGASSLHTFAAEDSMPVDQSVDVIIRVMPTVAGTVTNVAQVPDCPAGYPAPGVDHSGVLLGTTCPYIMGAIPEPEPTFDNDLSNNVAYDETTEVPPVILEGYDKGASAEPGTLWLAPGVDHLISTVSEVIYVVDAGANPNIVHTWTATPSNDSLQVAWQPNPWAAPGDPDVYSWTSTGHTDGEEFTTTLPLWVRCVGDGGGTVNIDLGMMAGNDPEDSLTSLKVNCETGQLVKEPSGPINLWLCKGPNCSDVNGPINGFGQLTIDENVSGITGTAGAFEFDVSFDSRIWGATGVVVTPTDWLGTIPPVDCSMTIVNENDIKVACANGAGSGAGTIATIALTPNPDLLTQMILTPGQDNGIVTSISDNGCEVADTLGDPIQGSLPSGLLQGCNAVSITVRVLEADLNLDCRVNVLDEQAIAYRYGASFGMLLYSPWYDLQPALKDNDIDIKDVQKVFGRDGSTCANPIPAQPPQ
jgi:uncharacterized repeat protein (TIGR01451 family)